MKHTNPFLSSHDVFDWISLFINMDRGQTTRSFRLERSQILAELAGHPEFCAPVIHVAGSKGKGSVTGMVTAMLETWGLKTARYTSPHITEYRERISQGNNFFEESVYITAGEELREVLTTLENSTNYRLFNPQYPEGEEATFFEVLTLYYFLCARQAKCDAMVVETGMGGRLDATNIVDPLVSIITTIELEHTEYLGDTLAAIAGEKAGIIKPKRPLILLDQEPESLAVFKAAASAKESPLYYLPDSAEISNLRVDQNGTSFQLNFSQSLPFTGSLAVSIPIPGNIQAKNAALSIIAVKTAYPEIPQEAIINGLKGFTLPARFERISTNPSIVIDGAHTPHSIRYCTETFTDLYGEGAILLFGCAAKKDAQNMAKTLIPLFSRIIVTAPGTFKTSNPEQVYEVFLNAMDKSKGQELLCIKDTDEAIRETIRIAEKTGLPVLCAGSFYLASEIRSAIMVPNPS